MIPQATLTRLDRFNACVVKFLSKPRRKQSRSEPDGPSIAPVIGFRHLNGNLSDDTKGLKYVHLALFGEKRCNYGAIKCNFIIYYNLNCNYTFFACINLVAVFVFLILYFLILKNIKILYFIYFIYDIIILYF